VEEAEDGLDERDDRADEDREDDREASPAFSTCAAEEEGEPERDRRQRVAEVVDQVGEQRDAEDDDVDRRLRCGRHRQDREAQREGLDPGGRGEGRRVDERTVRMTAPAVVVRVAATAQAEWVRNATRSASCCLLSVLPKVLGI